MKRDAPLGQKPPAAARDARSLRAQLSRAVGEALRAVRSPKTALPSKQRLSDVLWNDRTLLASAAVATRGDGEEPTDPAIRLPPRSDVVRAKTDGGEPSDAVEVVSDGEVEAWFEAALDEPWVDRSADSGADAEAAAAFGDALESAAAEAQRSRHDLNSDFDALLSETTNPVMVSAALLAAATPEPTPRDGAARTRRSTPTEPAANKAPRASEPLPAALADPDPFASPDQVTVVAPAPSPPSAAAATLAPAVAAVAPSPTAAAVAPSPSAAAVAPAPSAAASAFAVPHSAVVPAVAAGPSVAVVSSALAPAPAPIAAAAAPAAPVAAAGTAAASTTSAIASAAGAAPAPRRSRAADPDEDEPEEEPILTRSMARLLAGQGHRRRALKILDALLEKNPDDAGLRAEADALRQAGA